MTWQASMMAERKPNALLARWDIEQATKVLNAPAGYAYDAICGEGRRLSIFPTEARPPAELELYPQMRVVRYRSRIFQLQLAHVTSFAVEGQHLRIEVTDSHTKATLEFTPSGEAVFTINRNPAAAPRSGQQESPQEERRAEDERQDRVILTGRLGHSPQTRTTKKGREVTRLSLAVRSGHETHWHTVYFFDDLAARAAQVLKKGQLVTIVGYKRQREITAQDGTPKLVEEIYGAAIESPKKRQPKNPTGAPAEPSS